MIEDVQSWRRPSGISWNRKQAQNALGNLSILALDRVEVEMFMRKAVEVICDVLGVEFVSVLRASADRGELALVAGLGWDKKEVGERTISTGIDSSLEHVSMAAYAMSSREPVRVEDLAQDHRFGGCPLMREYGIVSGVMTKIHPGSRLFGVLGAYSKAARSFTDEEKGWLVDVASILSDAVARDARPRLPGGFESRERNLAGQPTRPHVRVEYLKDTMSIIAASTGGKAALEATARVAVRDLADWCFIDLVQDGGRPGFTEGDRITRMVVGSPLVTRRDAELANYFSHEYALDPTAPHGTPKVLREGKPELIPVVGEETLRAAAIDAEHLENLKDLGPTSYLAVPLRTKGRTTGTLVLVSTDPATTFDETHLSAAEDLASCAALVLSGAHDPWEYPPEGSALESHLSRTAPGDHLERVASQGEPAIVVRGESRAEPASAVGLTKRRLEILQLLSEHHTPKTIAEHLVISEKTVRTHVQDINRQLGVSSYREAVRKARSLGIVT